VWSSRPSRLDPLSNQNTLHSLLLLLDIWMISYCLSSSFHWKLTCSRNDIAELLLNWRKIAISHPLTLQTLLTISCYWWPERNWNTRSTPFETSTLTITPPIRLRFWRCQMVIKKSHFNCLWYGLWEFWKGRRIYSTTLVSCNKDCTNNELGAVGNEAS
jgi:hypothetical protein